MPRYIDADALYKATEKRIKEASSYRMAVVDDEFLDLINDAFTEDVVPKSEYIQQIAEKQAAEEAIREIFEEIEDVLNNIGYLDEIDFKALKKKYLPNTNDGNLTAAEAIANFHEAVHEYYTDNNHCVVCGESVPEGRQVCGMCEIGTEWLEKRKE